MQRVDESRLDAAPVEPGEHSPLQWKIRALRAVQNRQPQQAWLWADALCRHLTGPARADALMLRSAAFALRGDHKAADGDMEAVAAIDPWSPALNRALLNSGAAATRLSAAKRLLQASTDEDRKAGIDALARERIGCVGLIAQAGNRLSGLVMWNGPQSLALLAKSDVHEQSIPLTGKAAQGAVKGTFKWSARIDAALPHQARAVTLAARDTNAIFEPATLVLAPAAATPARNPASRNGQEAPQELLIVVPAFDGRDATKACLEHLLSALPATPLCRVVVVDDASPDAALAADLDALAEGGRVTLIRNKINMGFAASVNRALGLRRAGEDVLLLNADTVVPRGAIEALAAHVRTSPDIGTATPLSNNGEDTSFPARFTANPLPEPADVRALQEIAARVNHGQALDMPNGVGFCLYVNGAAIDRLGGLSTTFDRGYYEDVEFCLRAKRAGFRNVCAADAYVGHHGGASFGAEKRALVVRNLRRLTENEPGYLAAARKFEKADPLKPAIARIEDELLRSKPRQHLLLMPADMPAFLDRSVARIVSRKHDNVLIVRAGERKGALQLTLAGAGGASPQNLTWRFSLPAATTEIVKRLSQLRLASATIVDVEAIPAVLTEAIAKRVPDIALIAARVAPLRRAPKRKSSITLALPKQTRPATLFAMSPAIRHGFAASGSVRAMETLDLSGLPLTTPPKLKATGVLAIVGATERDDDVALLRALGTALPGAGDAPTVIVAGRLRAEHRFTANIHVGGPVDDEELPEWLTRLDAQAVLFADRKWGMADPRAALWHEAGLPVAWFGLRAANAPDETALVLPTSDGPDMLAEKIAAWLRRLPAA